MFVAVTIPGATTFTEAEDVFVGSVLLVAVTVTVVLPPSGAIKFPLGSIVPAPFAPPPVTVQLTPAGSPVALNCAVCPVPRAACVGVKAIMIALAVPVILITCGEFGALSVSVIVSERCPEAVGENVTEIVQDPRSRQRSSCRLYCSQNRWDLRPRF